MIRRALVVALVLATFVAVVPATPAEAITSSQTAELQRWLIAKGFLRDKADGVYGSKTAQAVMAFRKEIGVTRSFSWSDSLWPKLKTYERPYTKFSGPDRVEVNLTRQVMYLYRGGVLRGIFPIASGNGDTYLNSYGDPVKAYTPTGNFKFYLHRDPAATGGWHTSYLGSLYKPWYFSGGYAIHGSTSVPAEPASHGCVRLTVWDADWLQSRLFLGMPIHIWYEPKGVGPVFEGQRPTFPSDGPFWDVPLSNPFASDIAWLAESGVTKGCSSDGRYFCPKDAVTRGQMAAFFRRFLSLPAVDADFFRDDGRSIFEGDINALAAAGITKGCNPPANDLFCPDRVVDRGAMAAFLRRALDLPYVDTDYFRDDNGSIFEQDINAIAAAGITTGCATGYCPTSPVTREVMAALLHRAAAHRP
jgi:hypothetical protein